MWITKLELSNIKSHKDTGTIAFTQGVNAISGPNGAGKSSLLEAIGFALFDSLPYTQSQFLREGEKSGEVVVSFIDVIDEREYQIMRKLGSSSIYIFDPQIESRIVSGKTDVVAWLKEHLGVDPSADLTALFEDSIGVPQGLLSAAFMERPTARKSKFDPLLQVDEYEQAWVQLREVVRLLSDETETLRQEIAELSGELKQLPDLDQERSNLETEIETRRTEQSKLLSDLEDLRHDQSRLEADQEQVQELQRQLEAVKARLEVLSVQRQEAESALHESEEAAQQIEASEPAYRDYIQADERLEELEDERSERDRLLKQKNELEKELALSQQRVNGIESSLKDMEQIQTKIEKLEPRVAQQDELTQTINTTKKELAELKTRHALLIKSEDKLSSLDRRINAMRAAVDQRTTLHDEQQAAQETRLKLEQDIARLQAQQASLASQLEKTRQHRTALDESDRADCPMCHQPLDATHREGLLSEYDQQIKGHQHELKTIDDQLTEIEKALNSSIAEIDRLTEKLDKLPDQRQLSALEDDHQSLVAEAAKQRQSVETLDDREQDLSQLEQRLADLNDPKTEWSLLSAQLESRPEILSEKETLTNQLKELTLQLDNLDEQLDKYDDLEAQLSEIRQKRQISKAGYRSYVANLSVAEQLEQRLANLDSISEEHRSVEEQLDLAKTASERAQENFDAARLERVRADVISTSGTLARLETIIEESGKRLDKLTASLSELHSKQEALKNARMELERSETAAETLEFIRSTIRNAGPFVTRALVQTISLEANRIFVEIMNDHTLRLEWNEDYGITIEQAGEPRQFSQLSGGEKTAAALAVRLALLRELSQIRVAFFDEPTSNLDDERRENLASQITQITGFNQLFVISHDDTFERETHHVIHVDKSQGVSQVEVG